MPRIYTDRELLYPHSPTPGAQGIALGRLSACAAVRIVGRCAGAFTARDVRARFPQHDRRTISKALADMCSRKNIYRVSPGVYRSPGSV